jgi:hypothetical protein
MRRFLLFLALLTGVVLNGCGVDKSFVWQQIATEVRVGGDGDLQVTESLTLGYTGGPFTFAFRDLSNRRLDSIGNITVYEGERAFRQVQERESTEPYTFSISREDGAQRVRWVYPPTTGGTRTFTLRYDVVGAVRRSATADEVWWALVFAEREEVVEQAEGRILLPEPISEGQLEATTPNVPGAITWAPGSVSVRARDIPPGRELTLRLRFPTGVVSGDQPAWQVADAAQADYDATVRPLVNVVLSALAALLLVFLSLLIWAWWRNNRDPRPSGFAADELPVRPDNLSPALAGTLVGAAGGQALLGTLIDLANRGALELHETLGGWRGHTRQVVLRRTDRPIDDLVSHEAAALDAVFGGASEVALHGASMVLTQAAAAEGRRYRAELIERGYLEADRLARGRRGMVRGTAVMTAGLVFFLLAAFFAERYSWWLPVVAAVLALAGMAWLLAASAVRGVTQRGADALARWQAFRRYLRRLSADHAPEGQFDWLLPYAVALGVAAHVTKVFGATAEPLPVWYYPIFAGTPPGHGSGVSTMQPTLLLHDFSQNFATALSSAGGSVGGGTASGASGGGGGGAG